MFIIDWLNTNSGAVQAIAVVLLVVVTAIYAWRTHAMSKATKKQADASVRMAEEMREQRLSEAQPYLLLRLAGDDFHHDAVQLGKTGSGQVFYISVRNEGKGPAIDLWAALWHPTKVYFGNSRGYLALGEEWLPRLTTVAIPPVEGTVKEWLPELRDKVKHDVPWVVAVECKDIHGRTWVSYLHLEWLDDPMDGYVIDGSQSIVELRNDDT